MTEDTGRDGGTPGDDGEATVLAPLEPGTEVCVWNGFLQSWTSGFAIAGVEEHGYLLARLSDGHVFDDVFPFAAVLPERRRAQLPGFAGTDLDRRRVQPGDGPGSNDGKREPFLR
jgi:hypothetical protein